MDSNLYAGSMQQSRHNNFKQNHDQIVSPAGLPSQQGINNKRDEGQIFLIGPDIGYDPISGITRYREIHDIRYLVKPHIGKYTISDIWYNPI
jgi:hypothetical protein